MKLPSKLEFRYNRGRERRREGEREGGKEGRRDGEGEREGGGREIETERKRASNILPFPSSSLISSIMSNVKRLSS